MAAPLEHVRPGDLITADFINRILDHIEEIERKLGESTPGDALAVTDLVPTGGAGDPIRVGAELRIFGRNFRYPVGAARVFFDSTRVDPKQQFSNDSRLVVDVPDFTPPLPTSGRSIVLRVENGLTFDTRPITVLPIEQNLSGDVDVFFRSDIGNPNPNPIAPSQPAIFAYRLRSRASLATTFTIKPVVSIEAWRDSVQVLNASRSVITNNQIDLAPLEEKDFYVQIAPVPAGTNGVSFRLTVSATSGPVSGSDARGFTVGTATAPEDDTITLAFSDFAAFNANGDEVSDGSYNSSDNTIRLKPNITGIITLDATFKDAGTYNVAIEAGTGTTNWELRLAATPSQYIQTSPNTNETPKFSVKPLAGASATGEVIFRLQRQGADRSKARRFTLALITGG